MSKILRYELRRILCNRIFAGLLVVTLFFGWGVLTGEVIWGIGDTAPFSPWSFGFYLSQVLPMILISELFFLSFFTSAQERRVRALTAATPVKPFQYRLLRCAAVLTATLLLTLAMVAMGLWFYHSVFRINAFGGLAAPALFALAPPILLVLGLGLAVGRLHPAAVYLLMAAVLIAGLLPFAAGPDLFASVFFSQTPRLLGTLDPAFAIPGKALAGRGVLLLSGILLSAVGVLKGERPAELKHL